MNKTNNKPKYNKRITIRISESSFEVLQNIRNEYDIPSAFFARHVLEQSLQKVSQNLEYNS